MDKRNTLITLLSGKKIQFSELNQSMIETKIEHVTKLRDHRLYRGYHVANGSNLKNALIDTFIRKYRIVPPIMFVISGRGIFIPVDGVLDTKEYHEPVPVIYTEER